MIIGKKLQCMDEARLRAVLALIAAPMRADGTWNRDREACKQLAEEALRGTVAGGGKTV